MALYATGWVYEMNPSPVGGGLMVVNQAGVVLAHATINLAGLTENEAELLALLMATALAIVDEDLYSKSKTAIAWVKSGRPKARMDLYEICHEALNLKGEKRLLVSYLPASQFVVPAGELPEASPFTFTLGSLSSRYSPEPLPKYKVYRYNKRKAMDNKVASSNTLPKIPLIRNNTPRNGSDLWTPAEWVDVPFDPQPVPPSLTERLDIFGRPMLKRPEPEEYVMPPEFTSGSLGSKKPKGSW